MSERLENTISNAVGRLFRQVARIYNRELKAHGLSAIEAQLLGVLWERGPVSVGELQAEVALNSSTLTSTLDRLERGGHVSRSTSKEDRRSFRLELTERGKALRGPVLAALERTEDAIYKDLSERQRESLRKLLWQASASAEKVDD